jgi:lysophospholipase
MPPALDFDLLRRAYQIVTTPQRGLGQLTEQESGGAGETFDRRAIPASAIESRWEAADGHAIRRIDWPAPQAEVRGSLLFMPGRGDAYEKYLETLDHWHRQGWQVTAADWRGQAGSGRLGLDPVTGHIDDFAVWIDDLAQLWTSWREGAPGPHVLVGHSMGGHLVLRAMAEGRVDPTAAVLSAPMLGFKPAWIPDGFLHWLARRLSALGDARRPAWKWNEKPGVPPDDRIELLTHDHARYADELWWRDARPEIVMGPASWGWVAGALASSRMLQKPGVLEAIATPVLLLAVRGDRLVEYGAIERAARRLMSGHLVSFGAEARHEVLREADAVRGRALTAIDDFLDRAAPPAR